MKAYINVDASGLGEPYIRQRFIFAEIWYFKLLEDVLVSEKNRMPLNVSRMKVRLTRVSATSFRLAVPKGDWYSRKNGLLYDP